MHGALLAMFRPQLPSQMDGLDILGRVLVQYVIPFRAQINSV